MPFHRPLAVFCAVTFGVTWLFWSPFVLSSDGAWHQPALHLAGSWGPLLGAVLVLRRFHASWPVGFRHDVPWAIAGGLLPFGILLLAMAGIRLTAGDWPPLAGFAASTEFAGTPLLGYVLVCYLGFGLGEEIGWRGFVQPWLQQRFRPGDTALLMTPLWAIWHLPLFAYQHAQFHTMDAGMAAGWLVSLLAGCFLLNWVYNQSGGNVWAVVLLHGSMDVVFLSPFHDPRLFQWIGPLVTVAGLAAGLGLVRQPNPVALPGADVPR